MMKFKIKPKTLLVLLCILSYFALFAGFILACEIGDVDTFGSAGMLRCTWIMYFFIPVPLTLIGLSSYYRKKGIVKGKGFAVFGFIFLFLILIFGSYTFFFAHMFNYTDVNYIRAEQVLKMDLPDDVEVVTEIGNDFQKTTYAKIKDASEREALEREIEKSELWTTKLSSKMQGMLSSKATFIQYYGDAYLVYNVTDGTFDQASFDEGEYEIIVVAYDRELSRLIILSNCTVEVIN